MGAVDPGHRRRGVESHAAAIEKPMPESPRHGLKIQVLPDEPLSV